MGRARETSRHAARADIGRREKVGHRPREVWPRAPGKVAVPRNTLSQSQHCSYGPLGTRYGSLRTPDAWRHVKFTCAAVCARQSASSSLMVAKESAVATEIMLLAD